MLPVLVVGLFMTTPIALIAAAFAWGNHVTERRNRAWARVAQGLGLYYAADRVWGKLDGQLVQLRLEWRGSGKSRTAYTVIASGLTPPLDLGLSIHPEGFLENAISGLFGMHEVQIGDPVLDPLLTIRADEPARAARLLTLPLRQMLLAIARSGNQFELNDHGFSMSRVGAVEQESWLVWALRTVAHVAARVEESRPHVPAAWTLQAQQMEWVRFAQTMGLAWMTTPLCIGGRLGGVDVWAYAVRTGPALFQLEVLVRFEEPLGLGLMVRPSQALDGLARLFGGQDLLVGDPIFDGAFVIQASDPRRIATILDPEVRARAFELHQRVGSVQIRDDGITLRSLSPARNPAEVPRLVDALKTLAERLQANALHGGQKQAGPYR